MARIIYMLVFAMLPFKHYSQDPQVLHAYKYAWVPVNNVEPWNTLRILLINKHFHLLENVGDMPKEPPDMKVNKCLSAAWHVYYKKVGKKRGTDLYDLHFAVMDCKGVVVYQSDPVRVKSDSKEKFQHALTKAFKELDGFNHVFNDSLNNALYLPKVEMLNESERSLVDYFDKNPIDPLEGIYKTTGDGTNEYRIGIKRIGSKYYGIVCETNIPYWKKGEVKLYLEITPLKPLYPTTYLDATKRRLECFSELEDLILSISLRNPHTNENTKIAQFIRVYP